MNFEMLISRKRSELAKTAQTRLIEVDVCHRMRSLQMLHLVTLTYNFSQTFQVAFSQGWKKANIAIAMR